MTAYLRASDYAHGLLKFLRHNDVAIIGDSHLDAHDIAWQKSGLSLVTRQTQQHNIVFPIDLTHAADGALLALKSLAPEKASNLPKNGIQLIGERRHIVALAQKESRSRTSSVISSANGFTHLFKAKDALFALSLARQDDLDILPALTFGLWNQTAETINLNNQKDWLPKLQSLFKTLPSDKLVKQGIECGLPIAAYTSTNKACDWCHVAANTKSQLAQSNNKPPLVLDFSSLWAGPLAASLLSKIGARVIKIESLTRPDGARGGNQAFYDLLNDDKLSLALDFNDVKDINFLHKLVNHADIIIEGSRPRALKQLGLDAENIIAKSNAKTWLSITAYGRYGKAANRIGFGDDISVEAGLPYMMEKYHSTPCFVGDAIADPISGLHGAVVAYATYLKGGGLIDLPMVNVLKYALYSGKNLHPIYLGQAPKGSLYTPYIARRAYCQAKPLGADTKRLKTEWLKGEQYAD